MKRRHLLVTSTAAAGLATALTAKGPPTSGWIDSNVTLGHWPFRHLPSAGSAALAAKLREEGVTGAWAGHFDALLHKDLSAVNERLAEECRSVPGDLLVPVGAINPAQHGWEEDLRRCAEIHRMPGIRLHPNYHGYRLDAPAFGALLEQASARGLFVQIALLMEEERTLHPLVNVPPVDPSPLLAGTQQSRIQLLNAFRTVKGPEAVALARTGVRFEIATFEGAAAVGPLLTELPGDALLFGSHAPLFYFESAKLKLQESGLTPEPFTAAAHRFLDLTRTR